MGNCFTKLDPPECKHERFNEHNERYLAKVEDRNSTAPTPRRWWRRSQEEPADQPPFSTPTLTDPSLTYPEEGQNSIEPNKWKPSPIVTNLPTLSRLSPPNEPKRPRRFMVDAAVDGWHVKRKGHALQLRLAKNRFLQLAADSMTNHLSPITLDSYQSESKGKQDTMSSFDTPRPLQHDWNTEFENSVSSGMVWVDISRQVPVTAMAMTKNQADEDGDSSNASPPLLLAIGGQDGVVTVAEILDETLGPLEVVTDAPDDDAPSTGRRFGETLEIPLEGRIRSLDFSPDGQYLVAGGDGCRAAILRIVVDTQTKTLEDIQLLEQVERVDRVYSVQFSPDGSTLAVGGYDGKVAFGSVEALLCADSPSLVEVSRSGLVYCLNWSPNGEYVAIGGSDKCCAVLDYECNIVHETFRHTAIQALQWNHDGSFLAIGDREVAIVEVPSFQIKCEISNTPPSSDASASKYRIMALCWSPDGSFLAIGGSDGVCLVVETKGYALVHEIDRSASILCLAWGQLFMRGECRRYLAVSDENCNVAILKAGAEVDGSDFDELSSAASSSYFSSGSDWVLREDGFRDVEDAPPSDLPRGIKPQGNITCVAFSRKNKTKGSSYLAYTAEDCSLTIMTTRDWKVVFVSSEKLVQECGYPSIVVPNYRPQQMEFAKPLESLMFSYSSNYVALGGEEAVLYVLSVPSRSIVYNTIIDSPINSVAFSRHDERLAIGSDDGTLTLLCPDSDWEAVGELDYSESPILAQDWSSKTLAVGREDGSVAVFDAEKAFSNFFVPLAEFSHSGPVRSLSFGASGRFLAFGGDGQVVSILSSKGGWVLCNQFKLECGIKTTKWSPAGRYLAFAGSNQTLRVVDTITWAEVTDIQESSRVIFKEESTGSVSSIDWSVDGKWVALGSTGGGIHVLGTSGWQLLTPSLDRLTLSTDDSPPPAKENETTTPVVDEDAQNGADKSQ